MSDYAATRDVLHRIAAHVCARRRFAVSGRFGLRPAPGGFATPSFGDPDHEEVVRVAGTTLIRERRQPDGMSATYCPVDGASLRSLAAFAGVDLGESFAVGRDSPEPGDVDAPLSVEASAAAEVADWLDLGARALDAVVADLPTRAAPSVVQLWPEHFDLACDVAAGATRVNLGVSPGDGFHGEPYAYVGPWTDARPGDAEFWNAPFGAVLSHTAVRNTPDRVATTATFFARGVARFDA